MTEDLDTTIKPNLDATVTVYCFVTPEGGMFFGASAEEATEEARRANLLAWDDRVFDEPGPTTGQIITVTGTRITLMVAEFGLKKTTQRRLTAIILAAPDAARSTAWAVVSCAEFHRPRFVLVENVADMRGWVLYPAWTAAMRALGYALREHIVNAADCGVPQSRERLYLVGSRSMFAPDLGRPQMPRVPARTIIRWDAGRWAPIERPGRAEATLRRIREGRRVHGDRFLLAYYGSERGGRSLSKPLGTVTTRDRFAVVDGPRMRMLLPDEYRAAQGFPEGYHLPADPKLATFMLGNANPPPMARWAIGRLLEVA